ncbi:MAG: outer membrane lipoprotein carrier protein LolA [Salinirussus sp.]
MTDLRGSLRRRLPLVLVVVLLVGTGVAGAALLQPSGEEILDNVEQRYDRAENVVGTAAVTVANETETATATVEYVVADGNNSRLTVSQDNDTVVVGTNGTVGWVYDPSTGLARTYSNETRTEELEERSVDLHEQYGENVTVTRTGTEELNGTDAYVLKVNSTNRTIDETGQLWVATDDWTVLKAEVTAENTTVTVDFRETRFNVSVHESTYRPPDESGKLVPGAERDRYGNFTEARAASELTVPDLRDAYEFDEAIVASYNGTTTTTAVYDTDAGTVYVAVTTDDRFPPVSEANETETVEGRTVGVVDTRRGSAVYWSDGGTTTAVLTRGPPDTALDAAETALEG